MNFTHVLSSMATLAALVLVVPVRAQDTASSALIQGTVSNTTTGAPIQGAAVVVMSDSGSKYSNTTDNTGAFTLKGIPPAHYSISVSRSGFLPYDRENYSTGLSVSAGQQLKELRIRLTPTGSITGRVLDSNRQPVADAIVMAIRPTFVYGRQVLVPDGACVTCFFPVGSKPNRSGANFQATTDERGEYRIFGLPPGSYYVSVWSAGSETFDEATGGINQRSGYSKDQPPTYYPNVADPDNAIPITVNGNERQGIDLEVRNESLHRFRFQVVHSITAANANCSLPGAAYLPPERRRDPSAIVLVRHSQKLDVIQYFSRFGNTVFKTGEDNWWTSPPLYMGSYEVFYKTCFTSRVLEIGTLTTTLIDRDIDAGKLVVPRSASISGQVRKNDAPSIALEKLRILLRALDLRGGLGNMLPPERIVSTNGTFSFDTGNTSAAVAPGLYQVDIAGLPEDVYLASLKFGGREVRDTGFRVDTVTAGPLEIELSQRGGVVNGVVKDGQGKPVVDSFVALMPFNRELVYSNLFKETRTGQDGGFSIRGIPPGEYALVAVDNLAAGQSRSAEFRDQHQSRMLRITMAQGSVHSVNLTVSSR